MHLPVDSLTVVEPFCGAGGMAKGLHDAGYRCLHAQDMEPRATATLEAAGICDDVVTDKLTPVSAVLLTERLPEDVDLLAGGVPCQPFSAAGKNEGRWDPRDGFPAFLTLLRELEPRAFLIENVKGLTNKRHRPYLERVATEIEALGYVVPRCPDQGWPGRVHNAADWGVPQRRNRILIVGFRDPEAAARFRWPEPTHHQSGLVWSKWGEPGVERDGVVGGSYWTGAGAGAIGDPAGVRIEATTAVGRSKDEPAPTLSGVANIYTAPVGVVSAGRKGSALPNAPASPVGAPSKEEARVLKKIKAGKVEVRGPRWRTVRDALGGMLLATERMDREVSIDAPHPTLAGDRPGGGGASTLLGMVSDGGRTKLPPHRPIHTIDEPSLTMRSQHAGGGGGVLGVVPESYAERILHADGSTSPAVLGVVGDGPASKIASRRIPGLDEPSHTVRCGTKLKGGAGGGVLLVTTIDHPDAERGVDMAAGIPVALTSQPSEALQMVGERRIATVDEPSCTIRGHSTQPALLTQVQIEAIVRNTADNRRPEIVDPDVPAKTIRDESKDQFLTPQQAEYLATKKASAAAAVFPDPLDEPSRTVSSEAEAKQALGSGTRVVDHDDLVGLACRRGRTARDGTDRPQAVLESRSADEPSVALRGSAGGSSQPFAVFKESANRRNGGIERVRSDITDKPSIALSTQMIANRGPFVLGPGSEPDRLDRPSPAVTTMEVKGTRASKADGSFSGGPDQASDMAYRAVGLRRLTTAECAALQAFPPDWPWQGPKTAIYRQVGNALPPPLAAAIGSAIAKALRG